MALFYDNVTSLYSVSGFDNRSGQVLVQTFSNQYGFIVEILANESDQCTSWLLLPGENLWVPGVRTVLYILALLWMFIGVAIVADIFVGAIEVITSQKKQVTTFDPERQEMVVREVLIWNETVANLTLLALGSSAPEIMLATIEQVSNLSLDQSQVTDDLGTFTIVGSAAFNLLLITAVCVASVPSPGVLAIEEFGVFIVTAGWSLFAYLWLIITLLWVSPGEIHIWEAVVTLLFFPLLVTHAWAQSKGWWLNKASEARVSCCPLKLSVFCIWLRLADIACQSAVTGHSCWNRKFVCEVEGGEVFHEKSTPILYRWFLQLEPCSPAGCTQILYEQKSSNGIILGQFPLPPSVTQNLLSTQITQKIVLRYCTSRKFHRN